VAAGWNQNMRFIPFHSECIPAEPLNTQPLQNSEDLKRETDITPDKN
jgi:hypothetical protein